VGRYCAGHIGEEDERNTCGGGGFWRIWNERRYERDTFSLESWVSIGADEDGMVPLTE